MKSLAVYLLALTIGAVTMLGVVEVAAHADAGSAVLIEPMTHGSAPPSAALPNPATSPVAAWDEAKAARKVGWPLAVFAALVMLNKALAYGREKLKGWPVVGKAAAWLSVGKRAMLVVGFGTIAAAGYDVLMAGGSLVAAMLAVGVAVAGALHSTTKNAEPAKA